MFRLLFLTAFANLSRVHCTVTSASMANSLKALDFEVFGTVQGVFFRKFTKEQADKLGLRGWCMNTDKGTVLGHIQGPIEKIETMMTWLRTTGSPSSKIDKAEFRNEKFIDNYTIDNFTIKNVSREAPNTECCYVDVTLLTDVHFKLKDKTQDANFFKELGDMCNKLDCRGWGYVGRDGKLFGQLQGPTENMVALVEWITKVGSPGSCISEAMFLNEQELLGYTIPGGFQIKHRHEIQGLLLEDD